MGLLAIFAAGAVFGPVVIAAISALHDEAVYPEERAERLLLAYEARPLDSPRPLLRMMPSLDGAECGYDPRRLFTDDEADPRTLGSLVTKPGFSDYEGYYALGNWSADSRSRIYEAALVKYVTDNYSNFQVEFLHSCIKETFFSAACKSQVEHMTNGFDYQMTDIEEFAQFPAAGNETDVVCTYLDAVAARRGIAIPKRD